MKTTLFFGIASRHSIYKLAEATVVKHTEASVQQIKVVSILFLTAPA